MSLQTLLISVLVTCVTVGATFFYFRNRMQRTEQKVDLMFSLIQEHENNVKLRQQFQPAAVMQAGMSNNIPQEQFQNVQTSENELINISDDDQADEDDDDDSEYDSDDSAEVSDNDDDKLTIDEDSAEENLEDTVKTISLSLDGAETTASEVKIADIQNLEEHTVDENKQDIINKVFDQIEQTNTNTTTSESLEITEINDDLDEINLSDVDDEDPDEEDQTDATTMEQDGNEVTNYSKLTAKKLKELAKEKGLEAKGLKKKELIVLLSSS